MYSCNGKAFSVTWSFKNHSYLVLKIRFFFVSLMWIDDIIINVYYHQCAKKWLFYELKNSKEQQVEIVCKIILSTLTIHETFHTKKFEFQMGFK